MRVIVRFMAANSVVLMIINWILWVLVFNLNKSKMRCEYSIFHNYLTLLIEPQTISDRTHLYLKIDAIALECPPILKKSINDG